jgi:hypothetical protein
VVSKRLLIHLGLKYVPSEFKIIAGPVESFLACWFVFGIMEFAEVRVLEAALSCPPLCGVECEHFVEKVEGDRICLWVDFLPGHLLAARKLLDVASCGRVTNKRHIFFLRCSEYTYNSLNLIKIILSGEQRRPSKKLRKNTANTPHIDLLRVLTRAQNYFRSAVPSCNDVLGQIIHSLIKSSCQPQIANFQISIFVQEEVAGLEVSVNDVCGMHVQSAT